MYTSYSSWSSAILFKTRIYDPTFVLLENTLRTKGIDLKYLFNIKKTPDDVVSLILNIYYDDMFN